MPGKTVVDSGPLIALFDRGDQYHQNALEFLKHFRGELVSTVAVITEVTHLLDFSTGAQIDFIKWVGDGAVDLVHLHRDDLVRIVELTRKYADLPMDFADASLVAISERLGIRDIATIDADFHIYRIADKDIFHNVFFAA